MEAVRAASAELRRANTNHQLVAARFRQQVWEAYRAGATQDAIAQAAGITRQRVGAIIRNAGDGN